MGKSNVVEVLQEVERLTPAVQAIVREHLDRLAHVHAAESPNGHSKFTDTHGESLQVRPGLAHDLAALDVLAAKIGAAWKTERSATEAVNDMRREP